MPPRVGVTLESLKGSRGDSDAKQVKVPPRPSRRALTGAIVAFTSVTLAFVTVLGGAHASVARAGTRSGCQGVQIRPGAAIQAMIDGRPAGTTFCFGAGVYRLGQPIFPKSGDRLIGARGADLNGSKRLRSFDRRGSYWVATQQFQEARITDIPCEQSGYTGCRYPEGVFIDDRPLWQVTDLGALRHGAFFFDYAANEIYIADDPAGHVVETSVAPAAIAGYSGTQDGVLVRGFLIEKFANLPTVLMAAIKPGNGWTIERNEIRLSSRMGVFVNDRTVVAHNFIHDNGQAGIRGEGDGVRIVGNRLTHNNIDRFDSGWSGGVRVVHTRDLFVGGNTIVANDGPGIKTDTDNAHVVISGNQVLRNTGPGISHEKSGSALIVDNVLRNNARSGDGAAANIVIVGSHDVEIRGNRVYSPARVDGILLIDSGPGIGQIDVHDNLIRMADGARTGLLGSSDLSTYSLLNISFHSNTYLLERRAADNWRWAGESLGIAGWKALGNDLDGVFRSW
jgi:hypothetical protein